MEMAALWQHVDAHYGQAAYRGTAFIALMDLELRDLGGRWRIADTERGEPTEIHLETANEAEACARFLELADARSYRLAGFVEPGPAERLAAALGAAGLWHWRNDVPASIGIAERYRVFVRGGDLPAARAVAASIT